MDLLYKIANADTVYLDPSSCPEGSLTMPDHRVRANE